MTFFRRELDALQNQGLKRQLRLLADAQQVRAKVDGRELLLFASNNYLGLSHHPQVVEAACAAARQWGAGAGSARLVTGNMGIHRELEAALAQFKGSEDACLFSSGYLANLAMASLLQAGDAIFSDAHNHASIIDGCRLSPASVQIYGHGDVAQLAEMLSTWRQANGKRRALVVTDSVFSMDGDMASLQGIHELCQQWDAMLMVDEAHATGVVGPGGRGGVAAAGLEGQVDLVMGTLSKALGSAGGFIAGRQDLCDYLRNKARSFIFDTAPAPTSTAAALAALQVLQQNPHLPQLACLRARELATGLAPLFSQVALLPKVTLPTAAIVPLVVGEAEQAVALSQRLLAQGVLIPAIRPPAVPAHGAMLRATVTAEHSAADVQTAIAAVATALKESHDLLH